MAGETYVKRYGTGFTDNDASKPVDAQFLNAVETALLRLLGEDPAADEAPIWTTASNRFVFQKIANAHIAAAAAIDKTKLAALNIVDADVAAGAAISKSKLATLNIVDADVAPGAAIGISKLAGYPTDITDVLRGDGTWGGVASYRKTTETDVANTIAETDILGGAFTIGAGAMGTDRALLVTIIGDFLNNTGVNANGLPVFKVKLGATTLHNGTLVRWDAAAGRQPFFMQFKLANRGAANSQWLAGFVGMPASLVGQSAFFGSAVEDTALALALVVTVTHVTNSVNLSCRVEYADVVVT